MFQHRLSAKDMPQSKENVFSRDWFLIFILTALCIYLFVFKLGASTLWNFDEPIYGEVAKEMLKLGDWITPHFNYQPWFDKPPLYIWLTALTFRFFGWNEFTTRLWSALFGIGGVIVVYFLGKNIFNKRVGFLAGLVLAASFQYIVQSRLGLLDVPLNFFISLSLLFFYLGYRRISKKRIYYLLFFASMGLATLTKGPIGGLLPCLIIGLYLLLAKEIKILKEIGLLGGVIIYLAIAAPWYIIEFLLHGKEFINSFFLLRHIARYLTPFEGHSGPIYYYLLVLIIGFLPWIGFLSYSFIHLVSLKSKWQSIEGKRTLFLLLWPAVIFIFFFFAKSKLPGYILPLYPPLALCVGKFWNDSFAKVASLRKGMMLSFLLLFIFIVLIALILTAILIGKIDLPAEYGQCTRSLILITAGLIIGASLSFLVFLKGKLSTSFGIIVGMMCFSTWVLVTYTLPSAEIFKPTKFLAHKITSIIRPGEKIGNYPASEKIFLSFDPSLIYYTNHPVKGIDNEENLLHFLESKERVYCFMNEKDYLEVKEKLRQIPFYILAERGGKVLISNKKINR